MCGICPAVLRVERVFAWSTPYSVYEHWRGKGQPTDYESYIHSLKEDLVLLSPLRTLKTMEEESITGIKSTFIRSQVRHLSTPLQPSTTWRDLAPEPADGRLSDKAIQDIVSKGGHHNKFPFSTNCHFTDTNMFQSTKKSGSTTA